MRFHIFLSFQLLPFWDWSSPVTLPLALLIHGWHLNPPGSPRLSFPQMISAPCNILVEITCLNFRVLLMSNELMAPFIVLWLNGDCSLTKVALDHVLTFDRGKGAWWRVVRAVAQAANIPLAPAPVLCSCCCRTWGRARASLVWGSGVTSNEVPVLQHAVALKRHGFDQLPGR